MRASHLKELDVRRSTWKDIAPVLVSQLLYVGGDGCAGNWNLRVFSFLAGSLIHSTAVFSSDLRLNRILKLRTTFF
jgi:hypothetical protein